MVDYFMDDDTWAGKKTLLNEWYAANPDYEDRKVISDGLFAIGDSQPDLRKRHWSSIGVLFADLPNSPMGGGRKSLMPTGVKSDFDRYLAGLHDFFRDTVYPQVSGYARQHGKSGGNLYSGDADAFATDEVKGVRLFLSGAYSAFAKSDDEKRYHWDGTYNEMGQPNVVDTMPFDGGEEE